MSVAEARLLKPDELWERHARELIASNMHDERTKFLAVTSATRYSNPLGKQPSSHADLVALTEAYCALGGGGLALFGSGCLYTWAENLDDVRRAIDDGTEVDSKNFMDDSAYR